MNGSAYVIDADVLIRSARDHYAFDLAPGFWQSMVHHAGTRQIQSIDRVKKEWERGNDELAQWVKNDFGHAFVSTDEEDIMQSYSRIMNWVNGHNQFRDYAKSDFANGADGWLIAYAEAKGCIVVTHERSAPNARKKVKIPDVCQAFRVECVDTYEMLRRLGVRLEIV